MSIDPAKTAVVLIEYQNDVAQAGWHQAGGCLPRVARVSVSGHQNRCSRSPAQYRRAATNSRR
jgi:hypothetical protein